MAKAQVDHADSYTILTIFRGPLTETIVVDEETELFARAYAKQNPIDVYDATVGKELSASRAVRRLLLKKEKKLIREL